MAIRGSSLRRLLSGVSLGGYSVNSRFNAPVDYVERKTLRTGIGFQGKNYRLQEASSAQNKVERYEQAQRRSDVLAFPREEIKYYTKITYSRYTRIGGDSSRRDGLSFFNVGFTRKGAIYLPLPVSGMAEQQDVSYDEGSLEMGGVTGTVAQGVAGAAGETQKAIMNALANRDDPTKIAESFQNVGGNVGDYVTSLIPEVQGLAGVAPNKFMTVLLKGPQYRTHKFTWQLVPQNKRDSEEILQIVTKMNNLMAVGLRANGLVWDFPYVFYMEWVPNPKWLYKFKPMVMTSMQANYTPNSGVPSFYGGRENPPESVTINCSFMEIEYWLRNQFNTTNNSSVDGPHREFRLASTGVDGENNGSLSREAWEWVKKIYAGDGNKPDGNNNDQ